MDDADTDSDAAGTPDACDGEDRHDPGSWDDPDIAEAWADPPEVEPADPPAG